MTILPEVYVDTRRDEVMVRFDFCGPIHSLTRDGVSVAASRPMFDDELVYTPEMGEERLDAHERELDELESNHQDAIDQAEVNAHEQGREAGVLEAKEKLLDVIDKVVALPEVEALFVDGLGARDLLRDELVDRFEEAL